jgi:RNA polymerase sigma factor (sigma-70 family)
MADFDLEEAKFVAWLLRGLRRQSGRLARKARHLRQREILLMNQPVSDDNNGKTEWMDLVPSMADVHGLAEGKLLLERFRVCFKELTRLKQKVIQAVFLEGVSEREVARELGISQQSVNRIKRRAINRLKGCMEEWGNGTRT